MSTKKWVKRKIDKCIICKQSATSRLLLTETYDYETMCGGCIYEYENIHMCHWCYSVVTTYYLKLFPMWHGMENNPSHEYNKYIEKFVFEEEYDRTFRKITNINGELQSHCPNRKNRNAVKQAEFIYQRQSLRYSVKQKDNYHKMVNTVKLLHFEITSFLKLLPTEILNHVIFYL